MKLYDRVVLTTDLENTVFKRGDVGVLVEEVQEGKVYLVEFLNLNGDTMDVEFVQTNQIISAEPFGTQALHINLAA